MTARMNPYIQHRRLVMPLIELSGTVEGYGLDKTLVGLVKVHASQINGCAICLDMHAKEARSHGETEERILMLPCWRETALYTSREKAALYWTDVLTARLADHEAVERAYERVQAEFSDEEQVALTLLVGVINSFNRIGVGFALPPLAEQKKAA